MVAVDQMYPSPEQPQNLTDERPVDFRVGLYREALLRTIYKPQVTFRSGSARPFKPIPKSQAYPMLEWGMNWCIASYEYTRLIIHAAVLVRDGNAIIFPADPGSGKSTLAAGLSLTGWDLYSDEMAIIDLQTLEAQPIFRPVCLKNESIGLIQNWHPSAIMTERFVDTTKGDVAHLRSIDRKTFDSLAPARVKAVVFPKYAANTQLQSQRLSESDGLEKLIKNAFNYHMLGRAAFETCVAITNSAEFHTLAYQDLEDVAKFLEAGLNVGSIA